MRTHRIGLRIPKQAAELGGQARKGEERFACCLCRHLHQKRHDDKGADIDIEIPFMKGYTVFNAEQNQKSALVPASLAPPDWQENQLFKNIE